jgi:hypothetical protein
MSAVGESRRPVPGRIRSSTNRTLLRGQKEARGDAIYQRGASPGINPDRALDHPSLRSIPVDMIFQGWSDSGIPREEALSGWYQFRWNSWPRYRCGRAHMRHRPRESRPSSHPQSQSANRMPVLDRCFIEAVDWRLKRYRNGRVPTPFC